jgi:Rps23 Pro-64 3,4-dihydroxylase Tpa1-like proline 4-hydroxylase
MDVQRINLQGNEDIVVIDNLFTFSEIAGFETNFMSLNYSIDNSNSLEVQSIPNKRLVHKLDPAVLNNINFYNEHTLNTVHQFVDPSKYGFWRSYINLGLHSDSHQIHVDYWFKEKSKTLIYYANKNWDPSWGGSTTFFSSDLKNVLYNCAFVPGRIVIFDGAIPHSATPQYFSADQYRFTFVTKFVEVNVLNGQSRVM